MSFFEVPEQPPIPNGKRHREPRDDHTLVAPGYLPGFGLARSDERAVVVGLIECYPSGFSFALRTESRYYETDDDPYGLRMYGRQTREVTPATLRFGIEYSNGEKATTLDTPDSSGRVETSDCAEGPNLRQGGGGGGGGHWRFDLWVWPLPPEGPVTFACEWPAFGIGETLRRIEGARFHRAAAKSKPLFESRS